MFSKSDLDQLITEEAAPAVRLLPTHVAGREIPQHPIRLRGRVEILPPGRLAGHAAAATLRY